MCACARFRRELPGHEVQTVPQSGWASVSNGKLLGLVAASGKSDVFLTVDKNLAPEQNQNASIRHRHFACQVKQHFSHPAICPGNFTTPAGILTGQGFHFEPAGLTRQNFPLGHGGRAGMPGR